MPEQLLDIRDKQAHVLEAIAQSLAGIQDEDGRSPIVLLANDINLDTTTKRDWLGAIASAIDNSEARDGACWNEIELLLTLTDGWGEGVASSLETALSLIKPSNAGARASIYSMLAGCGRPVTAEVLFRDTQMKQKFPLLWLDLMLPLLPTPATRQSLVLEAVRNRTFGVAEFRQRLDEMRSVGGRRIGEWLSTFRAALPVAQRLAFDTTLREAGFDVEPTRNPSPRNPSPQQRLFDSVYTFGDKAARNPVRYGKFEAHAV
jgi:hypothetical protein